MRLFVGGLLFVASSALGVTTDVKILVDSDRNISTGCRVFTTAGNFDGVEQIFTTTFDSTAMTVSGVVRQQCTDPATATFGSPITVDATGWAVGTSGGNLVLETHIPYSTIGGAHSVRLGFTATSGTLSDAMLQQVGGGSIVFTPDFAIPGRHHAVWPAFGRTITRDGNLADWDGIGALVGGSSISSSPSLRFNEIRATGSADEIAFLFLIQANANAPTANPESFSVLRGGTLIITPPGILANDTDPHGLPLTAVLISGPQHGILTVNPNGSFTYTNDGSNAPVDSFRYKASNGTQLSNTANDFINILTGTPPQITSGNTATFRVGLSSSFTVTATGNPPPTLSETGALPSGVTFNTSTGVLSGTPAAGTGGSYSITFTATNAAGTANQTFTLNVNEGPAITSANNTRLSAGVAANFLVTTTGFPRPTVSETGPLPAGVTFTNNGNGTATIGGIPAPGSGGVYTITINASNVIGPATPQLFTITVCNTINVTNPAVTTATAGTAFSQPFTQTGAVGAATFTTASALPAGFTLATNGTLSGTTTTTGTFPISVTVTDSNGCTGVGPTYNLVINCAPINVTNPATTTGTAGTAFSQTFTQSGAVGGATFTTASVLPPGLTLAANGTLAGTPTVTGTFPIVVTVTGGNGCTGTGATYNLVINCQAMSVTNPATTTGVAGAAFSQTFTQTGAIGGATFTTASALPSGLTLATNGTLSGTPTVTGTFPIVVKATDANGCFANGATYNLVIGCQGIAVTNPATTTGTTNAPFSQQFTESGAIGTATFTTVSTLPTGFTLSSSGVLSGTTQQHGTFPIVVKVTDANGCQGTGATYNLVINCQTITVTNPATATGTVSTPFSQQFTQTGALGGATFTTASALPSGLSLTSAGILGGTPLQPGTFPIVVTVTDGNGCTGTSATYNLVIACQVILVGNPATTSSAAGTPLSINFTQTGAVGGATFTTASTLPTGLTLATSGTLSGTPAQGGAFPIVVTVTDGNGCTGTNPAYTLTITCPTITVTNPGVNSGAAGVAFSQTFTQSGGAGTITWSETGALPAGIALNPATGVLSGTTSQVGSFPITVTAIDQNGCTGTGATYTLTINCQTVTVTNPVVNTGTVDAAFSQTFTVSGILGTVTWSEAGALPAGITLNSSSGVLSGTPTVNGAFPITVKATDTNGCFGTSSYTLTINCQTITVTKPVVTGGTVDAPFSQTFTQSGAHGTATFTTASALPAGMSLSTAGVLAGTPTSPGSFSIVVTVTDSNGCTGASTTYNLTINCQTITVTNPANTTGTTNAAFSEQFTQSGGHGTTTFSTASTLPTGFSFNSSTGVLSGTTQQHGTFPIVVVATDANGCTGAGATYNLVINCQTITVTSPGVNTGSVGIPFSQQFTESGSIGGATFTTASTLPTGITLAAGGLLSGTPLQAGSFPIVVMVTDGNGCTGTGATYTLIIACNVVTVTNPATTTGTVDAPFSQTFTQTGGNGTITWSMTGAIPAGMTFHTTTGVLDGTPATPGSFPITVTATDANGCQGTGPTYTLVIACQTITVNNPGVTTGTVDAPFSQSFTQTGVGTHTPATFSLNTGSLPSGLTLSAAGLLSGTPGQPGSFPITVKVTDANGCTGISATYTLVISCQTITVTNPATTSSVFNAPFSQNFTQTGVGTHTPANFTINTGTLPTGLSLSSAGVLSGTPTQTGTFPITVKVTDANGCSGIGATYNLAITPVVGADSYSNLVDNTQAFVTGGATATPGTPAVSLSGFLTANDFPAGGVSVTAGTFATTAGGSVTIQSDGTFLYTPKANPGAAATALDTFTYIGTSNTGGTATPTTANGTVTLNLANRVWYVKNNGGGTNGQSQSPFTTLAAAAAASTANDIVFVYNGDGTNNNQNAGISLKSGQQLLGEINGLIVNAQTLVAVGSRPTIGNSGGDGVTVSASAGSLTAVFIKGLSVAGSANGININSSGANTLTATVDNVVVTGATANNGIRIGGASTTTSTVTVQNSTVSAATQNGIDAQQTSAGNLVLSINNNSVTATGTGININGTGSTATTITNFANNTVSGNTGGTGISVTTAIFDAIPGGAFNTVSGGITAIGSAGNGVGASGMVLTSVAGDLSFINLNIVSSGGAGLLASGTTPYTGSAGFQIAVGAGVATIDATGGPAADLNTVTANLPFNTIKSANSTTTGVSLVTVPGTFTAGAGSTITNSTGADFNINGSNATVTYGGTITDTTGRLVQIANTTGGTKSFSGAISDSGSGTGTGISLTTNTGATINFTGTLTLSTGANPAFTATGGGTVSASDTNSTIVTTTGTAINVANTTIGASNLKFKSVSAGTGASGPASGIILNTTGASGGLVVTGTGTAGSGGTIQKTGTAGLSLTSVGGSVSLTDMNITTGTHDGIRGTTVNNFSLAGCSVTSNGTVPADNGVHITDASGTVSMTSTSVTGSFGDNVDFDSTVSSAAVITTFTVTNGAYSNGGGSGFLVQLKNNAVIQTGSFTGVTLNANAAYAIDIVTNDNSTIGNGVGAPGTGTFTISGNTITNDGGVGVSFANSGGNGASNMYVRFVSNTMTFTKSHAINVVSGAGATGGTMKVLIDSNIVGTSGVPDSGSKLGEGIQVTQQGRNIGTVTITNNNIKALGNGPGEFGNRVVDVQTLGPSPAQGPSPVPFDVKITGNNLDSQYAGTFPQAAIYLGVDNQSGTPTTMHAEVHGNTVPVGPGCEGASCGPSTGMIFYDLVTAPSTGTLFNFGGNSNVSTELAATNTGTAGKTCAVDLVNLTLTATPVNTVP